MKRTAVAGSCASSCASIHSIWSAPTCPLTCPGTWVSSPRHSDVACGEREGDALGARAGDPVGERRAQRGAVLVVPGHEPGAVVPRLQDVAHGLVGDREIVIGVIAGDDEVVDPAGVLLDVGDDVLQQLAGRDLVEPSVGIREEVQVGQLDDAGQGHLGASLHELPIAPRHQGARRSATPSRRAATPFTQTPDDAVG